MIPDDQLTFAQLGCRGFLRLLTRAAVLTLRLRVITPAFLWLYNAFYQRIVFAYIRRFMTPQSAHDAIPSVLRALDSAPQWTLRLVNWLAFPPRNWQATHARAVAQRKETQS